MRNAVSPAYLPDIEESFGFLIILIFANQSEVEERCCVLLLWVRNGRGPLRFAGRQNQTLMSDDRQYSLPPEPGEPGSVTRIQKEAKILVEALRTSRTEKK
jgi:hypothetical protein